MAHLSGFDGSITGDLVGAGELGVKIEAFDVDDVADVIEARAKGDAGYTTFLGARKWSGTIEFLVQDDAAAASLEAGQAITAIAFVLKTSVPLKILTGNGHLSNVKTSSPIDGPLKGTATITGNGVLVHSIA